ncbi:phosphoenolpyruvate synthase/pyruvate phosphate dikinase [Desulfonema ishimotonii]|uniref:Phosphoenolpyruvate synthase/pyruvate phosphate dikinase n=1 Tax=Desulfonema ishimotonii TaxID=45657 RepID=A0A401FWN7_9BACT|nr:PEP/pyruvate-binding domain-containing protein [Desulfonema ishimotonii]GBC61376.1 phosphoenolpyruvate synthase/pyruvate phosphate dikinase [Desulfonema ishimotonii]
MVHSEKHPIPAVISPDDFDRDVKTFHELMPRKVGNILLVSTPYDAFLMEEDETLTSKIINEYRGLNLSRPPRLTKAATAQEALSLLDERPFDMVITMPNLEDMDTYELVIKIKGLRPDLPVLLLAHSPRDIDEGRDHCTVIDNEFIWSGNSDLLLALIKSVEDRLNVENDTRCAGVRVLILVEDSPLYRSFFLPLIYKVVVRQTLSVLEESLNEEHRALKMRARPKILVAENYEEATDLFHKFQPYVFGMISDTRYPRECVVQADAGFILLSRIRQEVPYLPLLLMSSEPENRAKAETIQAVFIDKNSTELRGEIETFFQEYLGFGDFVFRLSDKTEVGRATNLRTLEEILPTVPDEPVLYHARRNHFSNWLMARSEIRLASRFGKVGASAFSTVSSMRQYIIDNIHALRRCRQKGMVVQFAPDAFDPDVADFVKIGQGSLGGKARGLAFVSGLIHQNASRRKKYPGINIVVPRTLVIATDGFEAFVSQNRLHYSRFCSCPDQEIRERFTEADIPRWLYRQLEAFLRKVTGPLSVRSSSLLEDAHFQSFAGLYDTFMIPNNHPDFFVRLHHLITAIKRVYASTYFERPLSFAKRISQQFKADSMAVIIQQVAGKTHGAYYYPAISGVARSRNYYPVGQMAPEDGIARIALGMGRILDEENALRFCPRYPHFMPQFSTVDDILANAQRRFYALRVEDSPDPFASGNGESLVKRAVDEAEAEFPVRSLCSTYLPEEHRLRDTAYMPGPKVLTFAPVLKHKVFPLPELLSDLLEMGRKGMGGPVEIEFSVDLSEDKAHRNTFFFLQLRPMSAGQEAEDVRITARDIEEAFCFSTDSLGHGRSQEMADIVYVKPECFEASETVKIAGEIGKINAGLVREKRPWLLAGPGRWGSADRWLGIPVRWKDISGVGAMIEVRDGRLNADPSQGSHFFQKITDRGIHYITLNPGGTDFLKWDWLNALPAVGETQFLRHVRLERPFLLKNDGRTSQCAAVYPANQ